MNQLKRPIKLRPPHLMDKFRTATKEFCNIYKHLMHKVLMC